MARRRSWIRRLVDRVVGRPEPEPEPLPEPTAYEPEPGPFPPGFVPPPRPRLRQVTDEDYRLVPPEESNIGAPEPVTFQTFYDDMIAAGDIERGDMLAHQLLYQGWFADVDPDTRHDARDTFYQYTGMTPRRFDWQQWKDWYMGTMAQ